ncbi:MAG: adenosine deaminase [Glaciecola sp.]|jgi:uncharacterized protein YceK
MKKLFIAVAAASLLSGCATLTTDATQRVNVMTTNSKQVQASVAGNTFQAPGSVVITRDGKEKVITVADSDCANTTAVPKKITTAFWGNIIIGGLLGSTTDTVTGKMYDYDDQVIIQCK